MSRVAAVLSVTSAVRRAAVRVTMTVSRAWSMTIYVMDSVSTIVVHSTIHLR